MPMTEFEQAIYQRSALLLGSLSLQKLYEQKVIIFGVGGVGSWCAESLLRSGVHNLTLVDSDCVCLSNCNRQLMATSQTIGQPKVEALRDRLLSINPQARIHALCQTYSHETAQDFHLENFDYVIDAIDSLVEKALLIRQVTALTKAQGKPCLLSSMGAALRVDPTRIRVNEFWKIEGDPLARALRNKFRREKHYPSCKFLCVHSLETPLSNQGTLPEQGRAPQTDADHQDWHDRKVHTNGSLCPITGIFGMTLSGLLLQQVCTNQ